MDATAAATLFAWLDREVWLVTACAGERRGGLIATSVSEASIVPSMPRVLVGLARHHYTAELVEASGTFALHLLGRANLDWIWRFGLASGRDGDKFAGLEASAAPSGSPVLSGAVGWLDCRVEERLDGGDRLFYLAAVGEGQVTHFGPPLTVKRLLELAPAEQLDLLKRLRHLDAQRDAEAVQTWRERKAGQ
jgi:flavin reductase (DIM6/NTAB) family NADH-FMN oxidoreductase RutF